MWPKTRRSGRLPRAEEVRTQLGPLLFRRDDLVMRPLIKSTGDWELNEALLFRAHIEEGSTVVDIGAHVGYYTRLSAHAVGAHGRVVAVEPDPANAALLRENVRRNGLHNVTIVQAAAWRASMRVRLRRDLVNTGDNRVVFRDDGCEVAAIALDESLAALPVAVVKVDAQGTDHIALEGMRQTLARCRPIVFTEFWPQAIREIGDDPAAVIEGYRHLGFRITMIGFETDFATWSARQIVEAAEGFPFGAAALVLRPRDEVEHNTLHPWNDWLRRTLKR